MVQGSPAIKHFSYILTIKKSSAVADKARHASVRHVAILWPNSARLGLAYVKAVGGFHHIVAKCLVSTAFCIEIGLSIQVQKCCLGSDLTTNFWPRSQPRGQGQNIEAEDILRSGGRRRG